AEARDEIDGLDGSEQRLRHGAQQRIAHGMSERVIDLLEAIEVDAENGKLPAVLLAAFQLALQPVLELQAVRQTGEGVVMRDMLDLANRLSSRRDILDHRHEPPGLGRFAAELENAIAGLMRKLSRMLMQRVLLPAFSEPPYVRLGHLGTLA